MATLRFVLTIVLLAFGCALLIASFQPEQGPAAVWVGGGVHEPIFLLNRDNERYELSSRVITHLGDRS